MTRLLLLRHPRAALPVLLAALALSMSACHSAASASPADAPGHAVVVSVIDGDTIVVSLAGRHEHVRLIGVDTPETVDPRKPVACFGPQASAFTKHLLVAGTVVRLERDPESRDVYGRLLAYVYREPDELFVNLELARQGMADVLPITPNITHADTFRAAVDDARAAKRGLWAACSAFGVPATG